MCVCGLHTFPLTGMIFKFFFLFFLTLYFFFFFFCTAVRLIICLDFLPPHLFFCIRKRCIDFEGVWEEWWGVSTPTKPWLVSPAKLGYLQSWGCLKRLQLWLGVARPVPAACAIDLHWRQCVIRSPLETLTFKNSIKLIQLEPGEERLLAGISHKTPEFSAPDLFFFF